MDKELIWTALNPHDVMCLSEFLRAPHLRPILIVIFSINLPETVNSFYCLFEDDTKINRVIHTTDDQDRLQGDIYSLCDWNKQWLLHFKAEKM